MRALIYGHSQSGGMGLDLEKALRKAGFTVTRATRVGKNDKWLLDHVGEVPAGPYAHVFLYVGGNSDKPTPIEIMGLVKHFGADRTVVILPPVNRERTKKGGSEATLALRAKNMENFKQIADGVRTYLSEGGNADFEPDQIHMRPRSAASQALAQKILEDMAAQGLLVNQQPAPAATGAKGAPSADNTVLYVGLGVAALLGVFLLLRQRG